MYMKTFFTYLIIFSFLLGGTLAAQQRQITGKVSSPTGDPLPGVTVLVKGTAIGTYTKSDGSYKLSVPQSAKTLVFKQIGMKTKETAIGTSDIVNVSLEEDKILMEEVVVTAIGLEKNKKSIGYAIDEVNGKTLAESKEANIINSMNSRVAGVEVTNSAGVPGSSSFINIRGITSITGENQPLFIIDGVPIDNSMSYSGDPYQGTNNLLNGVAYSNRAIDINPDDVESMTVLKGPAATALYGIRAASGAIVITTKKGKAGTGEKINVSFTSTLAFDKISNTPSLQNKYAQGEYVDTLHNLRMAQNSSDFDWKYAVPTWRGPDKGERLSWGPALSNLKYDNTTPYKYDKNGILVSSPGGAGVQPYDNMGNFFQLGRTYIQSINMAGGTEFGNFYLSYSNTNQNGIVPNSDFLRNTLRFNGEARISTNLKASGTINYTNSGGTRIQQGSNTSGVMLGLLRTPPTFDISNGYGSDAINHTDAYMFADGTQRAYRGNGIYDNPFFTVKMNPFTDNVDRFIGSAQLNYYVTDWFDIMYRLGADNYTDTRVQIFAINSGAFPAGQIFNHQITSQDINSDLILNFTHKFTDELSSKLLVGNNMVQSSGSSLYVQGDGLIIPGFYNISNTSGQITRQSKTKLRRSAFYGDLTLSYLDWLYFDGTLRNEWSTTLPKNNNSFLFGAANLSFIFTDALKDIFKETPVSFGKLRMSYAVVGKDAPLYATSTPYAQGFISDGYTNGISFPFNGQVGFNISAILGNDQLTPEITKSWEVELNMAFFDNLFNFDLTYYNNDGLDQIFLVPIARSSGFQYQYKNAGEITNKGWEFTFNISPIKTSDWKWDLSLNFSKNNNMVEKLAEGVDNIFLGGFSGTSVRAVAGKPYGTIFGPGWLRDNNGNIVISDDPTDPYYGFPILDPIEKDWGSFQADWKMGISNSLSWNGLTFSFLIDIKKGGMLWNGTRGALVYFGTAGETAARGQSKTFSGVKGHLDAEGKLISTGQNNDVSVTLGPEWWWQGNGNGFVANNTEDFVENAGWVRLREISLSYTLPQEWVQATTFSEVSLAFTARNLWISTDYKGVDPETNLTGATNFQGMDYFNMPGTRTYNVSINIKF